MQPFQPFSHSTQKLQLTDAVQSIAVSVGINGRANLQVWINNMAGGSDVLVEFNSDPLDADSYRVTSGCSQPISVPEDAGSVRFKRPTGSSSADVYVTFGRGL